MIARLLILLLFFTLAVDAHLFAGNRLVYRGKEGAGKGRHLVLVAGDEEYRSEEALPMLAEILSARHGFDCTVLFAQDPVTGVIDPNNQAYIPGLETLDQADMLILFIRFRDSGGERRDRRCNGHIARYYRSEEIGATAG